MPCPHNEISIVQRSQQQSAVAAAAYQSGEKLFCGYDQEVKHYPEKRGIVHNEILLPANAPRSYADRNTLWNAAEAVEKQYSVEIWKRFRKWGGIPTGITQNIKDLLASREIENIFENSDFIYMLNQASGDRQILAKQLNISPFQLSYVTNSNEGEGLLFYGNTIIPFKDKFDTSLKLYSLMTTKPNEMGKYKEKKEA